MNYIEVRLLFKEGINEEASGVHIAQLGDMGFESFYEEDNVLSCYIQDKDFPKNSDNIMAYLSEIFEKDAIKHEIKEIEQQNWNALWESNFDPTILNDRCAIIAPFHQKTGKEIELVIMPKMSFGTGHHETTRMMMDNLFEVDIKGKSGLDMGCGTGVLGILAVKLGASKMDIIDIDHWAYVNAIENVEANGVCSSITAKMGDASLLKGCSYQFILANINRNILLADLAKYVETLQKGGMIIISGFLDDDIDDLKDYAISLGLTFDKLFACGKWRAMRFYLAGS